MIQFNHFPTSFFFYLQIATQQHPNTTDDFSKLIINLPQQWNQRDSRDGAGIQAFLDQSIFSLRRTWCWLGKPDKGWTCRQSNSQVFNSSAVESYTGNSFIFLTSLLRTNSVMSLYLSYGLQLWGERDASIWSHLPLLTRGKNISSKINS